MKKLLLTLIILPLLFGAMAFAQEAEFPNPGLTPDNSFYFLDTLGEKIGMFFAFSAKKKAEKALKYAGEKLAEVKAMAEQKEIKALEKANQKYEKFLGLANQKTQDAKERGKDVEELAILITEKTLKHQEVLLEIFEKVPEEAKKGIEKAIEVSRKGSEEAVQAVTGAKKEKLQQKIKTIDWQIFIDSNVGYTIKYPSDWRKVDFENGIGVGPQEIREDILWGIWFYDSSQMSEDEIISKIGSQFELGRNIVRENIKFNNIQALKVIATTSQFPDWYSESIIIEHDGKLFHIGNGAIKDDNFNFFYKSFDFIELKEVVEETPKEIPKAEEEKVKNVDACEKITDSVGKDTCYSKTAREIKDASLCEKITDTIGKDVCYSNIASDTNDINLCEKVIRSDVRDTCYSNTIPKSKDASLCEKIIKNSLRDYCYFNIAKETKDSSLCEKVIDEDNLRNLCYSSIAQETEDASLCEKITESNPKDHCYEKIAVKIIDINLCEKVTDRDKCCIDVAMEAGDIGLCERITDTIEKDVCYYGVVSVTKDSSMCEKMSSNLGKDECYFNVGMFIKDINLCEKITDSSMKDQCYTHAR